MIYSFNKRGSGGGSGSTVDTQLRASAFTQADLDGNSLIFKNTSGVEKDTVDLSGILPDMTGYYTKDQVDAFESADTQSITALQTAVSGNSNNITALQTAVSGNSNNITALQTAVSGNTNNITALQTAVSGNSNNITALQTAVSANTNNITALQTAVSANTDNISAIGTVVSGHTTAIANCVSSTTIHTIWKGSQADYDLLTPANDTLYIIT